MQSLSSRLAAYKPKDTPRGRTVLMWQDYAARIIKEFGIKRSMVRVYNQKKDVWEDKVMDWPGMIFRQAKTNLNYLEGKVALAREKCVMEHGQTTDYGHYLISLFRKSRPWEK